MTCTLPLINLDTFIGVNRSVNLKSNTSDPDETICKRRSIFLGLTLNHDDALPGVLGSRGIRPFISGEQRNKSLKLKGTKAISGNMEHRNKDFDFGE